jgi:CheY-like chemotaxis protein
MATPDSFNFATFSVLVVDDDAFLRGVVAQMCRRFDFQTVIEAADGPAGLAVLAERDLDFVICDWEMKPLDGVALTRQIRNPDARNGYVPIVMLTGHSEVGNVTAGRDAGVTEFLAKPISARMLLQRLVHIVEHPRPFIRTAAYFGPDRRRKKEPYMGAERRAAISTSAPTASGAASEVDALLRSLA